MPTAGRSQLAAVAAHIAADMDALVICRGTGRRSAAMVVLFGCYGVGEPCQWEQRARDSHWQARAPMRYLLLLAGRCWFEHMLPEGFLNAPGAGGTDALIDRQRPL